MQAMECWRETASARSLSGDWERALTFADRAPASEHTALQFTRSVHSRAGELHHLGPLLGVGRDLILRRAGQREAAKVCDPLLDLRIGHRKVHLSVEQGDDLGKVNKRLTGAV
jgi:hypothetical protein